MHVLDVYIHYLIVDSTAIQKRQHSTGIKSAGFGFTSQLSNLGQII